MWKEDELIKAKREEMEAALQIERNKEMLGVSSHTSAEVYPGLIPDPPPPPPQILNTQTAAHQKEKEDLDTLREREAELLVRTYSHYRVSEVLL